MSDKDQLKLVMKIISLMDNDEIDQLLTSNPNFAKEIYNISFTKFLSKYLHLNHYITRKINDQNIYYLTLGKVGSNTIIGMLDLKTIMSNPSIDEYAYGNYYTKVNSYVREPMKAINFGDILENKNNVIITCFRDPVERFISQYIEMCKPRFETKEITEKQMFFIKYQEHEYKKSLELYLELLENGCFYDVHMTSMCYHIEHIYQLSIDEYLKRVDYILLTETLDKDLIQLCQKFDIKINRTNQRPDNRSNNMRKNQIKDCVKSKEILCRVKKLYENDIKLYTKVQLIKESKNIS